MAIAPVPNIFANSPNGFTLPLAELDQNFAYLTNAIGGPLSVTPSMLSAGGPVWDATGKLVSQGNLVAGNGNVTSLTYPTNILNVGLNGFSFAVGTTNPFRLTTAGASVTGSLTIQQTTPSGVLTLNSPNVGINTSFTFPPDMGYAGYILTTDGNGTTAWIPPQNTAVKTFSGGTTGLTPSVPTTGDVVLGGILNIQNGGTQTAATPGAGQLLIGDGTKYVLNQLTAGPGCTITNAAGQITIALSTQAGVNSISGGTTGMDFGTGAGNVTMTGVLGIANGGTGQSNAQAALNALVGATTNNKILIGDGANIVLGDLTAGVIASAGTLSNNTSGSAATFTSTTQNSQFNSIGVGVAATGTAGEIRTPAAGNVQTPKIKSLTANTPPSIRDSADVEIGVFCRAFINFSFNGTGVTVNRAFNMSVTRANVGIYTLTFTTPMPTASYAVIGTATAYNNSGPTSSLAVAEYCATNNVYAIKTTGSVQIATIDIGSGGFGVDAFADAFSCNVSIFA
jgi:hypothetical protein